VVAAAGYDAEAQILDAEPSGGHPSLLVSAQHRLMDGVLCAAEAQTACLEDGPGPDALLTAACKEAVFWLRADACWGAAVRIVVALSPVGARAASLAARVRRVLAQTGLPATLLEVALSEPDLVAEGPEIPLLVSALRDLGAGVALAGTGGEPQSLRILRRLPLTAVRLDQALVASIEASAQARGVALATICTAHATGAITVALGVETALQRDILADLQCDEAQGPLFGTDVPAAVFTTALVGH
jgi:EAL domain-containing protein (putative c-di-GMP-specific phosphodiesterase class I)